MELQVTNNLIICMASKAYMIQKQLQWSKWHYTLANS